MSSSSSIADPQVLPQRVHLKKTQPRLLHQIEHAGKRFLELQCLLDLVCGDIGILSVFKKTRALVFTNKLNECGCICLPIFRKPLEILKDSIEAVLGEQRYCILCVLIEIRVEDSLVHEIRIFSDVEQNPSQIVKFEHIKSLRQPCDSLLDGLAVFADDFLASWLDLRDDRKAIAGR